MFASFCKIPEYDLGCPHSILHIEYIIQMYQNIYVWYK